jgi:hypothetical protein
LIILYGQSDALFLSNVDLRRIKRYVLLASLAPAKGPEKMNMVQLAADRANEIVKEWHFLPFLPVILGVLASTYLQGFHTRRLEQRMYELACL